jgi:hypothetical protein
MVQRTGTSSNYGLTMGLDAYGQLWMATLRQAIDDSKRIARSVTNAREARANRNEARAWIRAVNTDVGSLQWVCDVIDLPAERVRDELKHRLSGGAGKRRRGPHPRRHT